MKRNPWWVGLSIAMLAGPATSQEKVPSNREPWADLGAHAESYGSAAGNDLANEIVSRLHQKGIVHDAVRARALCKKAVAELLGEKTLVPFRAVKGHKKGLSPIGSPVTRKLKLALPEGFEWNEDVVIRFKADPENSRAGDPSLPDKMFVWMEFEVSNVIGGGGTMTVSGAASLEAEKKVERGESAQPAIRSEPE